MACRSGTTQRLLVEKKRHLLWDNFVHLSMFLGESLKGLAGTQLFFANRFLRFKRLHFYKCHLLQNQNSNYSFFSLIFWRRFFCNEYQFSAFWGSPYNRSMMPSKLVRVQTQLLNIIVYCFLSYSYIWSL